jgi:hypothetical protein
LLVQRKVTQRKHAPEPPTPPALPAFGCDARRRLRGPKVKSNILKVCATRTLLVFWFSAPSELAEHRSEAGGSRGPLFEPEARLSALGEFGPRPASRGAQGTARFMRGERSGVLSFGYFSLHTQRKVTRPRRGSRIENRSPQAIQPQARTNRATAHG